MAKTQDIINCLEQQRLLPLFYHDDQDVCVRVTDALYQAGIRMIEFTNRGSSALSNFSALVSRRSSQWPDLILAIGTIKTVRDARSFVEAGADFIISPGFVPEVAEYANPNDMLWVPGCMTPSEIIAAEALGARLIKLFPGHLLGPGFLSAIRELFPGIRFMPTGGVEVDKENLNAWFRAGACAVGMGSRLVSAGLMTKHDFAEIGRRASVALALIQNIR